MTLLTDFSDYIVYADESGDHGLVSIDPEYPIFALTFCMIRKLDYADTVVPAIQRFKFDFWGHDAVVLHEHDIRKSKGDFTILMTDRDLRTRFYQRLNELIAGAPILLFATVIDKLRLKEKYSKLWNPYRIALRFCMEQLLVNLLQKNQAGKTIYIIFESRGKKEDRELEIEFHRIHNNDENRSYPEPDFQSIVFNSRFISKTANSSGLQLADLTARPIALRTLRPEQPNRAYKIITPKLAALKIYP